MAGELQRRDDAWGESVMFSPEGISSLATIGDKLDFLDVPSHRVPLTWDIPLTWPGKDDKLFLADVERISEGCTPFFKADYLMVPVPFVGVQLTSSRSSNSLRGDDVICADVQSLCGVPCLALSHGASIKLSLLGYLLGNLSGRITSDLVIRASLAIAGEGDGVVVSLVRCRCIKYVSWTPCATVIAFTFRCLVQLVAGFAVAKMYGIRCCGNRQQGLFQ